MLMASKGHFFVQMPQPMHSRSEMKAIFESGVTSIQSLPVLTTGQDFLEEDASQPEFRASSTQRLLTCIPVDISSVYICLN